MRGHTAIPTRVGALMRSAAALLIGGAGAAGGVAAAQRPPAAGPMAESAATPAGASSAMAAWRGGLTISVNGSPWRRDLTVGLSRVQCPPSRTSPCATGSAVAVDVRFPPIDRAADLSRVRARLGEPPPAAPRARYEVRLVRSGSSARCGGGFETASALGNPRIAIDVGAPGPPLPLTCRWTAVVGLPASSDASRVTVVWSDTVVLQLTSTR